MLLFVFSGLFCLYSFFLLSIFYFVCKRNKSFDKKKLNTQKKTKHEKNMFFPGFSSHFPSICHPFFEQISMSVKLAMVDVRMFA